MITIAVNGGSRSVAATSVGELVEELGLHPAMVLVELNGTALHRSEWAQASLQEHDRVEILKVAAGG